MYVHVCNLSKRDATMLELTDLKVFQSYAVNFSQIVFVQTAQKKPYQFIFIIFLAIQYQFFSHVHRRIMLPSWSFDVREQLANYCYYCCG